MRNLVIVMACLLTSPALGQGKSFSLDAPEALVATGFLKHLLPRFSLKTGIRITIETAPTDAAFGDQGTPVFQDDDRIWHFAKTDGPHTDAFLDWLISDVGKRTIAGFKVDGVALYDPDVRVEVAVVARETDGDAALGEDLSLIHI